MHQVSAAVRFVAERYWPGATEETARVSMERVRASCEQLAAAGVELRWLGGTYVAQDEALSLRFEGTEAAVRAAHELAGVPFDRLVVSIEVEPDPPRRSEGDSHAR
jgi:hypothetical protein